MADTFSKLFRTLIVGAIALAGMVMAGILLVSTAIAVAIVYAVARLRGKPSLFSAAWNARTRNVWRPGQPPESGGDAPQQADAPLAKRSSSSSFSRPRRADIIDVEARDLP